MACAVGASNGTGPPVTTGSARPKPSPVPAIRAGLVTAWAAEPAALRRLCGGVGHQRIEAGEEEGEVRSGAFLPGGVLLGPADAVWARLPETGRHGTWGAAVVPWPTGDEAGPGSGHYVGAKGAGRWSLPDGVARDERTIRRSPPASTPCTARSPRAPPTPWAPMCPAGCGAA